MEHSEEAFASHIRAMSEFDAWTPGPIEDTLINRCKDALR